MHTGCSASAGNPDLLWYTTTFYPYMNLAMSCLMPFVLILVMNTIIGVLLCGRMRSTTNSSQTTTIAMLQAVSIAFLILTIPYPVYFICGLLYQDGLKINFNNILMAGVVAATCDSINHSINILLYSICGRRFRMVAARIITCGCHREGHKDERKSSQPTSNTTQETGVSNQIWRDMMTSWYWNAFPITDPLCGESSGESNGHRWIPIAKVLFCEDMMFSIF